MKCFLRVLLLFSILFFAIAAFAQNKVVVIPMGTSAKGEDQQIQYNDGGKTAGAEVYYDKATGKLKIPGEVRITDDLGNPRLWGQGRPSADLIENHVNSAGHCETSERIKFALSKMMTSWSGSAAACPIGTWVCTHEEIGSTDCDITGEHNSGVTCQGSFWPISPGNFMRGWLTNADGPFEGYYGRLKNSNDLSEELWRMDCFILRVWCCWE